MSYKFVAQLFKSEVRNHFLCLPEFFWPVAALFAEPTAAWLFRFDSPGFLWLFLVTRKHLAGGGRRSLGTRDRPTLASIFVSLQIELLSMRRNGLYLASNVAVIFA